MTFVFDIGADDGEAVYRKLVRAVCAAIADRRLKPGDKMPSIRELAASTGVSNATVNRCYEELCSQNYLETVPGAGTFVANSAAVQAQLENTDSLETGAIGDESPIFPLSQYGELVLAEKFVDHSPQIQRGAPLISDLPIGRWRELLTKTKKFDDESLLAYDQDPFGYLPLRQALAKFFTRFRSLNCAPEQVVIFPDIEGGIDLLCHLLLSPGDVVAVEDPCSPGRLRGLRLHGARTLHIPVDSDGMQVQVLKTASPTIKMVSLTPSHQDPTGVSLSMPRRKQLLDWAKQTNTLILENDFDCEYNYGTKYLPSIQSLDTSGLVVYRYTFWRALYPLVRMSLLVVPMNLVPLFKRAKQFLSGESPLLEQRVMADFIDEGHFDKHIQRTRSAYQQRRAALIHGLTKAFGPLKFSTAGMHLLVQLPDKFTRQNILRCAEETGINLADIHTYYSKQRQPKNEFMMGFAYYENAEMIDPLIAQFAKRLTSI